MSESAGLTLIETQIKAATGFSADNVSICNWGIRNSGKSDHYAIIRPGKVDRTALSFTVKDNDYQTIVEVWQQIGTGDAAAVTLIGHVDNITTRLDQYRKIADTTKAIRDMNVIGYDEVKERVAQDGSVNWIVRNIILQWQEEENITYAE